MAVTTDQEAADQPDPSDDSDSPEDLDGEADDIDDIDEAVDTDEEPVDTVGPRTGRSGKRHSRTALVAGIFVLAFGIAGFLGWKLWEQHTLTKAGQDAQQTAASYAQTLTSIDSENVDQNFADVLNGATGEFKDLYTKESGKLRQLLIDNKATAHSVVVDSAIQSESKDKVVVLLMVNQTVTNTARPDSRVDRSRMKLTMEKVDNRWLASKVELP